MKYLITLLAFISLSVAASEIKLLKVSHLGVMKNKVIFQSTDLKISKSKNEFKGKIIAKWGVHVFEVVNGTYTCNDKNICKLKSYETIAMFESCTVKNNKAKCTNKISAETDSVNNSRDVVLAANPDEVSDQINNDNNNETSEFPVRIEDEYADIF